MQINKSNFIRQDNAGRIYLKDRNDKQYLLSNQLINEKTYISKNTSGTQINSKFKLVTVRKLTYFTSSELKEKLNAQQTQLKETALRTKQPIPFKDDLITDNTEQVYGVFIDEDLYGINVPVYIFSSENSKIKCFITANGTGVNDWSIHIAHIVNIINNPNNTKTINWRLYSIDSNLNNNEIATYILESKSLPSCFSYNFDLNSLNYLGGGCWTALGVDINDKIPNFALAPLNGRYSPIGLAAKINNSEARTNSLVSYSFTPTYSFTWCRGVLKLNKRLREAYTTFTNDTEEGTYKLKKEFTYNLALTYRPLLSKTNINIKQYSENEYSYGQAEYVGNTNLKICSAYQCPDYGTDNARVSLKNYSQNSNVIRAVKYNNIFTNSVNKNINQNLSYLPVLASSNNMSTFIKLTFGEGSGSISHGNQIKSTSGSRSYGYSYDYKSWWTYGKVLFVYPYGDTRRFLTSRSSNSLSGIPSGSMFDFGQLLMSETNVNSVFTTWDAPVNPPSGFFPYYIGTLNFIIQYINPPIFGHDSIYYYEINPAQIDAGTAENNYFDNSDEAKALVQTQQYYSQIQAAIGGVGLSESFIGNVNIGSNETDTLIMRNPTATQLSILRQNPEYFPVGFWVENSYSIKD